ncbi:MMPL family transporter [Nocardia aurantia]|uniref:Membrane protein YdfJ n=1 Tax=Nocardia aurantia TaxID=2585199 RepID=A0A7K0DN18_9NOCA|nr:MMPL family transporter [Nocardia aurantia]MQY26742.1 Membrane protein YdfJ [Nocardia aurantia]
MASVLFRLGRFCFQHKWAVIAGWLAAVIGVAVAVQVLSPAFQKDFDLPGTDSGTATSQVAKYFPAVNDQLDKASTSVLVAADDGLAAHTGRIDQLVSELRGLDKVADPAAVANPVTVAAANPQVASSVVGDNGKVGLIQVRQDVETSDLDSAQHDKLVDIMDQFRTDGLQVEATGSLMQVSGGGATAELLGFGVAFIVMIIAFGALIAAFIPLVTAIVGVVGTIMLVTLAAQFLDVNQTATAIVTMLGIAVSIDYALFIVSRYRSELRRGGSPADAVGRAVGTAGSAVVFAGLTVVIAVVALMVVGIPLITQMGAGAAVAVVIAVASALTLIPAALGATGSRAFTPRIPWIKHAEVDESSDSLTVRLGRLVTGKPIAFIVVGLALLAVAAIPATKMELGLSMTSAAEQPAQSLLARGFGEGINGPLLVVLHNDNGQPIQAIAQRTVDHIKTLDDVTNPDALTWIGNGSPEPNTGADSALISVIPRSAPAAEATHELMEQIREFTPAAEQAGAQLHVGGQTAITSDLSSKLSSALIPYLIVVVGLAFLIMIAVFRSLWVPLIATVGFIFSVLATIGLTVAIFQEGALGLITYPGPILSFLPIILIGVVFGLAMDYQVFLTTRMREEFLNGMSAKDAIIAGYRHGGRVVASAAIIMISVFAAFMLSPDTISKMLGFGLAVAVLLDAIVIRMMVVPAIIALLGERAWGLPAWLDKLVPDFDIEGTAVRDTGLDSESPHAGNADVPATQHATVRTR